MQITKIMGKLSAMIQFVSGSSGSFSSIKITADDPRLAKQLADVVISELKSLNKELKNKAVVEKTSFIENRIFNVSNQLSLAEKKP